jgi:cold shock CspA family protein
MATRQFVSAFLTLAALIVVTGPLEAKSKSKAKATQISGVYCKNGGNDIYIPASGIKKSLRQQLRKGQKFSFTHGEVGSISCRAY